MLPLGEGSEASNKGSVLRLLRRIARTRVAGQTITELERSLSKMNLSEREILELYIEARNSAFRDRFKATPFSRRILLLPQCLRPPKCPAKLEEFGYRCERCGDCRVQEIIEEASSLGYRSFLLPGGTVVEKILKHFKPLACLGVACLHELVLGISVSENNHVIPLTVPLLRDGCMNTEVDWKHLRETLRLSSIKRMKPPSIPSSRVP